jgi:DNA adenine methylase
VTHLRPVGHPPTTAARTLPDQPRQDGVPGRAERQRLGPRPDSAPDDHALAPRPFLKWAGGKRQLLPELRLFYPRGFGRYFEPFVGSGAVFFDLAAHGLLGNGGARLSDVNADVVGCYQALVDTLPDVIKHLRRLASAYEARGEAHYYEVRDGHFNPSRRKWRAARQPVRDARVAYSPRLAAMLIYLNRTGFNGLFRLNSRGEFNVPVGRYANPRICDEPTLHAAARTLSASAAEVRHESFERALDVARRGDFIYLDPPYAPLTATSRFTAYTESGFTGDDQRALQRVVVALAERGCHVLLSNSTAPLVRELYEHDPQARDAGLRAWRVRARRAINARGSARGPIDEFLITNVPRRRGRTSLAD